MTHLMLQNVEDWRRLASHGMPRPVYDRARPTPEDLLAISAYNYAVGPFATADTVKIEAAIDKVQRANRSSPLNGQRCVLVTGRSMDGKTSGMASVALKQSAELWQQPHPGDDRNAHIPWSYVEVSSTLGAAGLIRSVAATLGIPLPKAGADVLPQLRRVMPEVGAVGLIIDDVHKISGAKSSDSMKFADTLKALITGLPVTIVMAGVDLLDVPALRGGRGDQVLLRSTVVKTGDWPTPRAASRDNPWLRLLATLRQLLVIPHPKGTEAFREPDFVRALIEGSFGRPGLAIDWIKDAADRAVREGKPLTLRTLETTQVSSAEALSRT